MKKKINARLIVIAVLAIFSTMLLITIVYYDLFRGQMVEDLKTFTKLIQHYQTQEALENWGTAVGQDELRITLIGIDGEVMYDNVADISRMENHSTRPEIEQALLEGEGQDVRHSQTLDRNTFYYAVLLQNGNVLRVAKEAGSLFSIFLTALPSLIMIISILILLCLTLAHYLTRSITVPIEKMAGNMEDDKSLAIYEELTPFLRRIRAQHQDIIKNAKIRQEFTANVSHELKTPLTSISGYAELIETGMASEADTIRFAAGIRNSANRLLTLINDIIRLSELDATEEETAFERLNIYQMACACVEMLSLNAQKHNVYLELKGNDSFITGNRQMIEELLYNLCDNAIRYNQENGRVIVQVYPRQQQTILVVSDTGIGIPNEHQERIFERFYRVDKSRSKQTGGTGLGLAIVKHIIVKHNARIALQSKVGEGTEITVIFS